MPAFSRNATPCSRAAAHAKDLTFLKNERHQSRYAHKAAPIFRSRSPGNRIGAMLQAEHLQHEDVAMRNFQVRYVCWQCPVSAMQCSEGSDICTVSSDHKRPGLVFNLEYITGVFGSHRKMYGGLEIRKGQSPSIAAPATVLQS